MRTLLLADESVTVQRVIALTFAEQPIRVVSVPDGRQAMEKMAAERPDIVLAGTSLPLVSGYDLALYMRSNSDLHDVPVLLLSGAFETVDDARLTSSGANGVLEKPVEPTLVIGRVKELLGLKSDDKPAAPAGRPVTPAAKKPAQSTPAAPRALTPVKPAPSKEEPPSGGNYSGALDAAFDSLDQQLSSPTPSAQAARNPAGPIGPSSGAVDPRSPGARPPSISEPSGNPVYEVDEDWFGDKEAQDRGAARTGRRELAEDLRDPRLMPSPPKAAEAPVYEVDDDWFAEHDKARAAKAAEHQQLAAEMGIHDVDLPELPPERMAPPRSIDTAVPVSTPQPRKRAADPIGAAPAASPVADDFADLLAFEQGERKAPPMPPPPEIRVVTPEITSSMLDEIAARVADRLGASVFGDQLRETMSAVMRDTVHRTVTDAVRPVVAETSERVVREVVAETSERVVRDVVGQTSERVVREVVAEKVDRAVREVVSQTTERAVREVVSQTTERVVREIVPETAERAVREVVTKATERAVPEMVSQATERAVRDVIPQTAERVVREVVGEATDRSVQQVLAATTERVVREVLPSTAERVVREVVAQTADRAVREVISETSERLVREEIERIKSRSKN